MPQKSKHPFLLRCGRLHLRHVRPLDRVRLVITCRKVFVTATLEMTRRYGNPLTEDLQAVHERVSLLTQQGRPERNAQTGGPSPTARILPWCSKGDVVNIEQSFRGHWIAFHL